MNLTTLEIENVIERIIILGTEIVFGNTKTKFRYDVIDNRVHFVAAKDIAEKFILFICDYNQKVRLL